MTYSAEEVLARLVDRSLFWEILPERGREMIVGVGRVAGLYMGFVINRQGLVDDPVHRDVKKPAGILYREGIAKVAAFSRACNDDGIPIVWLQDISGFDIGVEAERLGLLGYGSSLIYTNSTNSVPMFTVLLRKASGAGYYAMAGMPYEPVVQLSTPITRQSVMEGRTLAIAAFNTKLDDDFEILSKDPTERAAIVTTDQTGCREVVGDAALLVRAGDEQAIRAAFERLGSDADLRERLGREARNRIDKLFSWPAVAGQYVDVFESLSSLHGQRMNAAEIK
jgi:acetyl-CoA carboxylase carboxyltransferase component